MLEPHLFDLQPNNLEFHQTQKHGHPIDKIHRLVTQITIRSISYSGFAGPAKRIFPVEGYTALFGT